MGQEQALSVCNAIDLDQMAQEAQATSQAAMLTETPETDVAPPNIKPEDICSLLPVDRSLVTDASELSCVAVIDALLGCSGCNSRMSISLTESEEHAQQSALAGSCGNPKFFARGDSPVGDVGYTCAYTGDDPYREGVAQSYFIIIFSYGPYVASISARYPGQEAYVVSLAQGIVDRIDRLPR
jgi:hypothetical protein